MGGTLAFDVYGTLIDPLGISKQLQEIIGEEAPAFTKSWREKQIEYLFRRALGKDYQPFSVCTAQAPPALSAPASESVTGSEIGIVQA